MDDDAFHYFDGQRWLWWNGASWIADPYRHWNGKQTIVYNGVIWAPMTARGEDVPPRPPPPARAPTVLAPEPSDPD